MTESELLAANIKISVLNIVVNKKNIRIILGARIEVFGELEPGT
jgi:hypothetical protein